MQGELSNWKSEKFKRIFIKYLMAGTTIVLISIFVVVYLLYNQELLRVKSDEQQDIKVAEYALESFLDDVASDLKTMSSIQLFRDYLMYPEQADMYRTFIEDICVNLIKSKPLYNQIRFINNNGVEVFRIDNNWGSIHVYPKTELQYKGDRYYFKEAIKLSKGEIYLSPFDLNVEHGIVELPYRPVIRLAIPIFDNENVKKGIMIVNYSGEEILNSLKGQNLIHVGNTYILNSDNYFLLAPVDSLEWGFMFPERTKYTLCTVFHEDENVIDTMRNGQFLSNYGLYTFAEVVPFSHEYDKKLFNIFPEDYSWKIMFFVPHKSINWKALLPWKILLVSFIIVMLLVCGVSFSYARTSYNKWKVQQELIISERNLLKSNKTKDQFFSILSHDLRNSAATILSFIDFLDKDFDSFNVNALHQYIKNIHVATYQHHSLLNEILNWARLQLDRKVIDPTCINLEILFDRQYCNHKLALEKKNIHFEKNISNEHEVWADLEMTNTVFRNLINNAIKFTPNGGTIRVEAVEKMEKVEIKVIDTGVGIAETDLHKLFDLLTVLQKPGTENEPGSGFGLKLVAEMITKNNGTIRVESELGKGSQFIVTLPGSQKNHI